MASGLLSAAGCGQHQCSLSAFRTEMRYTWPARAALLAIAAITALNLLPPAWTPSLLLTPEFRIQTALMLACLGLMLISPLLALLPMTIAYSIVTLVAAAAIWLPVSQFLTVLPGISELYRRDLSPGWGMVCMAAGLAVLALAGWVETLGCAKFPGARHQMRIGLISDPRKTLTEELTGWRVTVLISWTCAWSRRAQRSKARTGGQSRALLRTSVSE